MNSVDQIVTLASTGHTDTLRDLLAYEAALYRNFAESSPLVRDIEAARSDLRGTPWEGPFDDHPEFVLMDACPHPLFDCFGYCCCGADLSALAD